ncbi:NADH-quinone oxidoreductase subunit NuoF [Sulfurimonas sp. MAG313]|nr:NADH-quinone oxidoreductase subunit NuoF [Sulfurimonas sp. MAG313]MDF1881322.1 NADH-quinone oxidoreductase subunit NuoF [Sulfurimonas sp. MAG313]
MICKIVSKNFEIENLHTLEVAKRNGAYKSIDKAFKKKQTEIESEISKSGLRGKGGGGAPAGAKWCLVSTSAQKSYLVVNADESEPGTFKDREIMDKDPHLLIEGILLTCYAINAHDAYIYIRGEYKFFADRLNEALKEAYADGILGQNVKDFGYRIDITVHRGAGAYICGEKSALIESLEGNRGHPRLKPHEPSPEYYFGKPTLVNNVETIATVPFIINNGADAYRSFGTQKSPGTLLFGMSGHINKPGIYEMAFGESMQDFINILGGGVKNGKKLKAVIPGGASTPILSAKEVQTARLDYESLREIGSALGTGGMIIMDEDTCMVKVLKNLLSFYSHESCGQCTPCREGTAWVDGIISNLLNKKGKADDIELLSDISKTMNGKTICVFAPAVAMVIDGFILRFRDEFEAYIKESSYV